MKKFLFLLAIVLLTACGSATKTTKEDSTTTTQTSASDADKVATDKAALTISGDLNNVTDNLTLPTSGDNGTTITWESSNPAVIKNDGTVIPSVEGDATVILAATITLNDASDIKEFIVIVKQTVMPEFEIVNPGFETGSLSGWTATGDAFKDEYVLDTDTFWAGDYNKDGDYLFTSNDHEGETGTLTSTTFELSGSGWISFKLGAAKHTNQLYMSVIKTNGTEDTSDDEEIARFGNTEFDDNLYTANLVQYKADLSAYLGEDLYIKIIDEATSDWAWISMDSFFMNYESEADLPQDAVLATNIIPNEVVCDATAPSANDIINGGFDTGNICGWTPTGEAFTHSDITDAAVEGYTPEGGYLYSSYANNNEGKTGTLTSSTFELGGSGYITFRLGGAKPKDDIDSANYISIYKEDGTEISRFMNKEFNDSVNMYLYKADLSEFIGENLYIKIVDNATSDWGTLFLDSFNTYYAAVADLPQDAVLADNLIAPDTTGPVISGTHDFNLKLNGAEPNWLDGITANDDVDGSVNVTVNTSNVDMTQVGTYTITYTAVDLSNNTTTVDVNVVVSSDDTIDPTISGVQDEIFVVVNTTEPEWLTGVTASDNADGDITANIVLDKGTFDIATIGTYTITYKVADASSNEVTATTTVYVVNTLPTIENGGFETGDLTGWTADGAAFVASAVVNDGENNSTGYYYKPWDAGESNTGTLTSSTFNLMGSGYITFEIGAAKSIDLTYVSVYKASDNTEIARYGNYLFDDKGEVITFKADLSDYLGENLYFVVTDNATTDWGLIVLDNFVSYYKTEADLPQDAKIIHSMLGASSTPASQYDIANGSFETKTFDGWTATGDAFTDSIKTQSKDWWGLVGKDDYSYLISSDPATGTLQSSTFTLNDTGIITFRMGGGQDQSLVYISVYTEDGTEIARYGNSEFDNNGFLNLYKADLTAYIGQNLYIQLVDNATESFGWLSADDFTTNYASVDDVPADATAVVNILTN